jgi:hypothetical protein
MREITMSIEELAVVGTRDLRYVLTGGLVLPTL